MAEYNKFADLKRLLSGVESIDDYQDLIKPKLNDFDDLQSTQDAILHPQISKRFNLKPENLQTSDQLQNVTNQILEQDYPHINKLRNMVGEDPLKASYANVSGGLQRNITKTKAPWDVRLGSSLNEEAILPTLGHEIGHANDDITKIISSIIKSGDNENSTKVRDMLLNSNDKDIQNFLTDLEKHPNIHNQYNTKSALSYDTPKLQQHLEILKNNPELVNSSQDLQKLKAYLAESLSKDNSTNNLDKLFRGNDKLGEYIKDYDKYHIPSESRGQHQASTDYAFNKSISDLVPDNSVLNSNADRHHLPRIDEIEKKGLLDKGNWELRNISRLFAGKGLKNLLLPGLGIGATALSTMDKAQAGDIPGAALAAGSIIDPTGLINAAGTIRERLKMSPEEAENANKEDRLQALPIGLDIEESVNQQLDKYKDLKNKIK